MYMGGERERVGEDASVFEIWKNYVSAKDVN
jgi:hypothetical protein